MFNYGDIVEIGPDALLIVGHSRDIETRVPNVANALMYKSGAVLVVIDNGATQSFRDHLDAAARRLAPFDRVMLIITHGHVDHVGNNAWVDSLGVPAMTYMSNHDLSMMRDQAGAFAPLFDRVRPFVPGLPPGKEFVTEVISHYGPLDMEVKSMTFFESLPLELIEIGQTQWNGWRLLDGEVVLLQTSGHTAGHVAVFIPRIKHFHIADETTSYYQAFLCGHAEANLLSIERAAKALKDGDVKSLTDGHSFMLYRGEEALTYLDRLVQAALYFDAAILRILREHPDGITVNALAAELGAAPELKGAPAEADANPVLKVMRVVNKLMELGIAIPGEASGLLRFPR